MGSLPLAQLITHTFIPVASEDYTTLTTILTFEARETRRCVDIAIVDDCVVERKLESFRGGLTRTRDLDSRIRVSKVDAVVNITDDDGTYYVD